MRSWRFATIAGADRSHHALEMIGPIPGTVISRRHAASCSTTLDRPRATALYAIETCSADTSPLFSLKSATKSFCANSKLDNQRRSKTPAPYSAIMVISWLSAGLTLALMGTLHRLRADRLPRHATFDSGTFTGWPRKTAFSHLASAYTSEVSSRIRNRSDCLCHLHRDSAAFY